MSFIPSNYAVKEGSEAPVGSVIKTCKFCKGTFAIPSEEASKYEKSNVCDCDECKEAHEKEIAAAAAALMKPPTDAAETIKTALGN